MTKKIIYNFDSLYRTNQADDIFNCSFNIPIKLRRIKRIKLVSSELTHTPPPLLPTPFDQIFYMYIPNIPVASMNSNGLLTTFKIPYGNNSYNSNQNPNPNPNNNQNI